MKKRRWHAWDSNPGRQDPLSYGGTPKKSIFNDARIMPTLILPLGSYIERGHRETLPMCVEIRFSKLAIPGLFFVYFHPFQ